MKHSLLQHHTPQPASLPNAGWPRCVRQPSSCKCTAARGVQPRTAHHHTAQPASLPSHFACKEANVGRVGDYDIVLETRIQVSILHNQDFRTFRAQRPVGKGALTAVRLQHDGSARYAAAAQAGPDVFWAPCCFGTRLLLGCCHGVPLDLHRGRLLQGTCCAQHGCSSQQVRHVLTRSWGLQSSLRTCQPRGTQQTTQQSKP